LPAGQSVELNRDDYTRPTLADRATSYEKLIRSGVLTPDEARAMERLQGDAAASQLTGGLD
jgi:phage portal protein BeeE